MGCSNILFCSFSEVVWEFDDEASLAHAKAERSSHLVYVHEVHELHAQETFWTEIKVFSFAGYLLFWTYLCFVAGDIR